MKGLCKYRFKTEAEFKKECGFGWRYRYFVTFTTNMDYLFGTDFIWDFPKDAITYRIPNKFSKSFSDSTFIILKAFLIEKKVPSYKPKRFIKEV